MPPGSNRYWSGDSAGASRQGVRSILPCGQGSISRCRRSWTRTLAGALDGGSSWRQHRARFGNRRRQHFPYHVARHRSGTGEQLGSRKGANTIMNSFDEISTTKVKGVRTMTTQLQQVARRLGAMVLVVGSTTMFATYGQQMPAEYDGFMKTVGKQGDFKDGVLKVNIPRNDVKVTIDGIATPTPFGFGGWLALTKGDGGMDVMMGDLVLQEDEVNPVMSALLDNGLEVTAVHNHFFFESPRMFYMHVHGHGKAADLAKMAKPAVDLIGKGSPQHQSRLGHFRQIGGFPVAVYV